MITNRQCSAEWVQATRLHPDRWSPEYYKLEYTQLEDRLLATDIPLVTLGRLGRLFSGPFGSELPASLYNTSNGVPLLRVQNIGDLFLNQTDLAHIPRKVHESLHRSRLVAGDLAFAKAGRLGAVSRIPSAIEECNITQHIVGMQVSTADIDSGYLVAFFLSKYGRYQLQRQGIGTLIKYLGVSETRATTVARPDEQLQRYVGNKVRLAEEKRDSAVSSLAQAWSRFDTLLRPQEFSPRLASFNRVRADLLQDHLSAEYYMPRYFDLERHLRALGLEVTRIVDGVRCPIFKTSTPERVEGGPVPCIVTSDIDPFSINWRAPTLRVSLEVLRGHSGQLEDRDVVYTSVGPPVGEAAVVLASQLPLAVGGDVSVIRTAPDLKAGYLCLFLNSRFGQMQNDRSARGIRQRRVYPEDISQFLIPLPRMEDQEFIDEHLLEFERLMDEALDLTNEARLNVEALVEGHFDLDNVLDRTAKSSSEISSTE
jgi:type I restriction enzyme S subunit